MAIVVTVAALVSSAPAQQSTPLTLAEAVQMTLDRNPLHKAALADTRAALASVREARAPLLPNLRQQMFTRRISP